MKKLVKWQLCIGELYDANCICVEQLYDVTAYNKLQGNYYTNYMSLHVPLNAFLHFNKKYIEMCIKNAFLRQKFQIYTCWQWGVLVY